MTFYDNAQLLEIIERVKTGDKAAFEELYDLTYEYVYRRAKYMTNHDSDALDLVQDVYVALFRDIDKLQKNESLYGWLKTVTFRQGIRLLEKNRKSGQLGGEEAFVFDTIIDDDAEIEESYGREQDLEFVKDCILTLSEEQRLVVLAYYYDELKVDEIAAMMGISPGTVKSRLHLARKKLKDMLKEQEEKQGYRFYGLGGPLFTATLHSILESFSPSAAEQQDAVYESLQVLVQGEVAGTATDAAQTVAEPVISSIWAAILAKLAELGAKKVAVTTVSTGLAVATVVGGYVAVKEKQTPPPPEQQVVQEVVVDEPEEEEEPVEAPVVEEETEPAPEPEEEVKLEDPREVDPSYDADIKGPSGGQSGVLPYGESTTPQTFTLSESRQVSVLLKGTWLNSNGTEDPIEGRYLVEFLDSAGNVTASATGEIHGADAVVTETLAAGTYTYVLHNEATEMDLFDELPYDMWIYY